MEIKIGKPQKVRPNDHEKKTFAVLTITSNKSDKLLKTTRNSDLSLRY